MERRRGTGGTTDYTDDTDEEPLIRMSQKDEGKKMKTANENFTEGNEENEEGLEPLINANGALIRLNFDRRARRGRYNH